MTFKYLYAMMGRLYNIFVVSYIYIIAQVGGQYMRIFGLRLAVLARP